MPALTRYATTRDEDGTQSAPHGERIRRYVVTIAFWSAVGLPLVYVPILLGGVGVVPPLVLIGLHLLALVGGRGYARPMSSSPGGPARGAGQ